MHRVRTIKLTLHGLALLAGTFMALSTSACGAETFETEHYVLKVDTHADGLVHPWGLAFLPDGKMLVTERPGRLRIIETDGTLSAPLDGLPEIFAVGQGGLLDVALDPDFERNARIYFSFAEPGNDGGGTSVAAATLNSDANRLDDVDVIFRQLPKANTGLHFGSRLVFDREGRLFITTGDRGQRERVQDFGINRGQIIRINADGTIPEDNPFVGRQGYRPEVWSYGHRNPQGAALHPETGELWEVEHGARGGDEINVSRAGRNYGWPIISYGRHYSGEKIGVGTHLNGLEQPVFYWDPSIAPSGMTFYTGDRFPAWKGNLFVGALKYRLVARLVLDGDKVVAEERILEDLDERIRDIRQGPDGYLYLLTDSVDGRVLRVRSSD